MSADAAGAVAKVLESGYIGQGPQVERFEEALSRLFDHPAPLTLNSGTSGLTLALRLIVDEAAGRSEVLAPPVTCTATNWPILALSRRIRWVDTNPRDGNMDLEDLRRKLSPQTAAIMLVHWGGYPNDLNGVREVQRECESRFGFSPPVIEDAAHALGSTYEGKMLGGHGNYTVYSLQAIKHLTAGDGGVLLCPDDTQTEKARLLRWYGIDRRQSDDFRCEADIREWGYKFHMNDINATIGLANLSLLEETIARHRENGAFYRRSLADVAGITLLEEAPGRTSSYWLFTIRAQDRDGLQRKLKERGIASGRVHERNDGYTCTRDFRDGELPGTDVLHREMLCIPVGWWVGPEQREYIADVIQEGW